MSATPVRIGIVGIGKIARDQHVPVIRSGSDFVLSAVASGSGVGVEGAATFPTLSAMLAGAPDLQAVAICTPPGPRYALAREALLAGRHVLLEKPPAATLGEIEDLTDIARTCNRILFATWHSRFAPGVEAARLALAGTIVESLRVTWKEDVRHWHPGQAWIWEPGGFGVFDPGSNALSIVTRIMPEPIFLRSAELDVPANRGQPIAARLAFRTAREGGTLEAEFDWRQTGPQTWDIAIETTSGRRVVLSGGGSHLAIDGASVHLPPEAEYRGVYQRFAQLIRDNQSDADASPLRLVADAFLLGRRNTVEPYVE